MIVNNINDLNLLLSKVKFSDKDLHEEYPNIFIVGAPRSGTTLLNQMIAYTFDIGYVNQLIARFWEKPYIGAILSKELKLFSLNNFSSEFGFTQEITNVHEFGYFWKKYFNRVWERDPFIDDLSENDINWDAWRLDILSLNKIMRNSFVYKATNIVPYIKKVQDVLNQSVFIYIKRDAYDVALSILKARKKRNENFTDWWSFKPYRNFKLISQLDCQEQVIYQIYHIMKIIEKQISNTNFVVIEYTDLCRNPQNEMERLYRFIKRRFDFELRMVNAPIPQSFKKNNKENNKIIDLLKQYGLWR